MAIELKAVNYIYMPKTPYEKQALSDVNFTIEEGSFTAIAGHTGSGKSTLVQHLNGLLHPTSGAVVVDGVNLTGQTKAEKAQAMAMRQRVGMVFQYAENQLFEETIAADIAFGPRNQGLTETEIDKRVREAMLLVGLDYDKFAKRSPFKLSGGQMRRVAIAGVLALHPKYLVLDEPTAGLDPIGRRELLREIVHLYKKWHLTIILVSHSMEDIAELADSLIVMSHGKMLAKASPAEVFNNQALLNQAGLKPPHIMTLLAEMKQRGLPIKNMAITPSAGKKIIWEALKNAK